ncbi:MAG: hypothetical protein JST30_03385 [Armatimonadetes bacterium]|nr:hypothetical protein [Armatimonadota bacterium]
MRALLASVLVLAVVPAFAQDPVALKRTPTEGETTKYKLRVETEISGMQIKFAAKVTEKVTKVNADGTFTVSSEQSDQVLDVNGQEQPAPGGVGAPMTTTYKADGSISSVEGSDDVNADVYRAANMQLVLWPKDPVKVGTKWEADVKGEKGKSEVPVHFSYEIAAFEKLGTRDAVKLNFESKETSGSDPATSKGTVWVDAKSGATLKTEAVWTNMPIAGQIISGKVFLEVAE